MSLLNRKEYKIIDTIHIDINFELQCEKQLTNKLNCYTI